jgi:hypothetical protein
MNQFMLMQHILIIVLLVACQWQINCEQSGNSTKKTPPPPIRLRSFNLHQLKMLREMAKDFEAKRKLHEEIEKEALRRRKESEKREEMEKRRLIQNFLNSKHIQSKSFLNDFNVNRFF